MDEDRDPFAPAAGILCGAALGCVVWVVAFLVLAWLVA